MNIRRILTTVAFAALAMLVWTTIKVYFIHDPDNFFEVDARPYAVAWMIANCKTFQCDRSAGEGGTAIKAADEADEGWLYLIATRKEPGEVVLLVPRDDPHKKHLVSLEQDANGDLRVVDNGPDPQEMRLDAASPAGSSQPMNPWKKLRYALIAAVLLATGGTWLYRRMKRGDASLGRGEQDAEVQAARAMAGSRQASEGAAAISGRAATEGDALRKTGAQFQSLMAAANKGPALELGRDYVGLLLAAGRDADAAAAFKGCVAADPAFRLAQAEHVLPIAKAARAAGDSHTAVAAVRGFDKKYPGHALLPDVYVFSAKLMAEDLGNAETAKKVLQHVVERYPGHHLAQEARRALETL
ncbi:MAG TPA: tetratricopeptide repeat protein [Usitatibacter sp.]|jgi:hypothetical protein|nr:tetratricopeptide repeat protein [Usitatibacter sp.]